MRLVLFTFLAACGPRVATPTVVDTRFADPSARIVTIDIAPIDVYLRIEPGAQGETAQVRSQAEATLGNTVIAALDKRAYTVGSLLKKHQKSTADATLYIRGTSLVPHAQPAMDTTLAGQGGGDLGWFMDTMRCDAACTLSDAPDPGKTDLEQCSLPPECSGLSITPPHDEPRDPVEQLNDNAEVGDAQDPSLFVTMSLWDNRAHKLLWQAHSDTIANAAHQGEVTDVARALLASLPARR